MRLCVGWFFGVLLAAVAPVSAAGDPPVRVTWIGEGPRACVEVAGLDAEWLSKLAAAQAGSELLENVLSVRVVAAGKEARTGMLGRYQVTNGRLQFIPRFLLEPGLVYRARLDVSRLGPASKGHRAEGLTRDFQFEESKRPRTQVAAVYPSATALPENLLRFYIHFTAPMSRGESYRRIHLLDEQGRVLADPFLELDEELWTPDQTRFTLLFDPGRIKRGLVPNRELGPALQAGRSYTLVIDQGWPNAHGQPLNAAWRKSFRVIAPDHASPDPRRWQIEVPAPASQDPLVVHFGEPLDHALLERLIGVRDPAGKMVAGRVVTGQEERSWSIRPQAPWRPGAYVLVVGGELEDAAGNSVARPFEVDQFAPITPRSSSATLERVFEIAAKAR